MSNTTDNPPLLDRMADWATDPALTFSEAARHQARLCFVDTLACMYSGADEPVTRRSADAMVRSGATGTSRTVVQDIVLSAPAAALVNGTAAHAQDFDDYEVPASTHPSAPIVPALLAINDLEPKSIHNMLDAYLVGYETIVRMGQALGGYEHYLAGWHATSTVGSFGATAAAAKLLNLPSEKFAVALGMTCSMAAGLKAQFGTDAKPLHAGFAARTGVEATMLADAGINANPASMEAEYGFLERYGGASAKGGIEIGLGPCAMDSDPVLRKPWPSCAYTHRIIEATLAHAQRPGFDASSITGGIVRIPEPYFRVSPFLDPQTSTEARFSILYCAATVLVDGFLTPASFHSEALTRQPVRDLMKQIQIDAHDVPHSIDDMAPDYPDTITLAFAGGGEHSITIAHVKGGPDNPLSDDDVCEKFSSCGGSRALLAALIDDGPGQQFPRWAGV